MGQWGGHMVGRQGVTSDKRGALRQTSPLYDSPILPHSENEISIARSSDPPPPQTKGTPEIQLSEGHFWILNPNTLVIKKAAWGIPWLFSG